MFCLFFTEIVNVAELVATRMSYLSQLPSSISPYEEKSIEASVERTIEEEQHMGKILDFMKRPEKSVGEVFVTDISMEDMENNIESKVKDLKQREKHIMHEISRMEYYKNHLEKKIQSMKYDTEHAQGHLVAGPSRSRQPSGGFSER